MSKILIIDSLSNNKLLTREIKQQRNVIIIKRLKKKKNQKEEQQRKENVLYYYIPQPEERKCNIIPTIYITLTKSIPLEQKKLTQHFFALN